MRIVKEAEERKNEILDAAEELFVTKGYDKTSTGDILDKVGIARGTLYYHFKSKEDILNAMIERINDTLIGRAKKIASDTSVPVIERVVMAISALTGFPQMAENMAVAMVMPADGPSLGTAPSGICT